MRKYGLPYREAPTAKNKRLRLFSRELGALASTANQLLSIQTSERKNQL
jgi:hypothetical protein